MAKTNAQRQAAYRIRRLTAGPRQDGQRQLKTWISTSAFLALRRLAHHEESPQRLLIERLIEAEHERVLATIAMDSPEWDAFFEGALGRNKRRQHETKT